MSTDSVVLELKNIDKTVASLEDKLPFFQRFKRRWLDPRKVIVWEVSGAVTGAKMLALFTWAVTPAKMAAYMAAEYPLVWGLAVKAWQTTVAVAIGTAALIKEAVVA